MSQDTKMLVSIFVLLACIVLTLAVVQTITTQARLKACEEALKANSPVAATICTCGRY